MNITIVSYITLSYYDAQWHHVTMKRAKALHKLANNLHIFFQSLGLFIAMFLLLVTDKINLLFIKCFNMLVLYTLGVFLK